MGDVDFIEVSREANQLEATFGRDAWIVSDRWAKSAANEGKIEEAAFWSAVSSTLQPR